MQPDTITLTVPARGEYAKTVRMAAAQLGSRIGMTYDEVDDVRIAAEEAFVYACDCTDEGEQVTFSFTVSDDSLGISVGPLPHCCAPSREPVKDTYAAFILRSVCDGFDVVHDEGRCMLRLDCRMKSPSDPAGA